MLADNVVIKVSIVCADCKMQLAVAQKPQEKEIDSALSELADSCEDEIAWHNRNHGQQVYAAYTIDDSHFPCIQSTYPATKSTLKGV